MDKQTFSNAAFSYCIIIAVGIVASVAAPARAEFGDELFKLTASDAAFEDRFGVGVDISGNVAIVGAWTNDDAGTSSGSAYLFNVTTGQELFKLTASDAVAGVGFGGPSTHSVAISGNTAIVGGSGTNKAYVFDVTTGQELRTLTASDASAEGGFGSSVAISNNIAIVSASSHDGAGNNAGAAYIFDVTTGLERLKLTASDATAGDFFGSPVDISGNIAVVGARQAAKVPQGPGALYVFDVTTGQELFKLNGSEAQPGDWFGSLSVDISDHIAIVGNTGHGTHAAYLFDITTGQELRKLYASDDVTGDFGWWVAISGDTAIVGARNALGDQDDATKFTGWGAAYLFDVSTGEQLKKLTPADTHQGQMFGRGIEIDGNMAIVGAEFGDNGTIGNTGSAYLFDVSRGPAIGGDFNTDGTVDAADYIVWRNGLGTTHTQADYNAWRANFGRSAAGAAAVADSFANANLANIPEPITAAVLSIGLLPMCIARQLRRRARPASCHFTEPHLSRATNA